MHTVESLLEDIYGSESEASKTLVDKGLIRSRSAISNWKAWGYFPTRLLPQIMADAAAKDVSITVADIPVMPIKPKESAA